MWRKALRVGAAILFMGAGCMHFVAPGSYLKIMPPWVPWAAAMVYFTGVAEIAGGAGLLIPALRRWAAWGLTALLVCVFPANIYMATNHIQVGAQPLPEVLLWARLPLQAVLIWWVLAVGLGGATGRSSRVIAE